MKKIVWVLLDNRMGSVGQIRGISQVLDSAEFEVVEKKLEYTKLSALPNFLRGRTLIGLTQPSRDILQEKAPDVVLSGSRRTAPIARWIKKQSQQKSKIIQLLYPGFWGQKDFDLIFVPEHDRGKLKGSNVFFTIGSPHRITDKSLEEAKKNYYDRLSHLPHPIMAVVVGGRIKGGEFSLQNAKSLAHKVKEFHQLTGGSILLATSWRTGAEAEKVIVDELKDIPQDNYLWGDKSPTPLVGYMAYADNLIVTGDSVSMCCEACGTGKPVYVFSGENWLTAKHKRFIESLFSNGYATSIDNFSKEFCSSGKLNPAYDIATKIKALFEL